MATVQLPNLERLLAKLATGPVDQGDAHSYSPPHERALARAIGLPVQDGRIAFAARDDRSVWAFVTPCHWRMGQDHVTMLDPQSLDVSAEESRALLAAMLPYFAEDGIELLPFDAAGDKAPLHGSAACTWLARGEPLRDCVCASIDRVAGRDVADWMPKGQGATLLRRLQSEMQMLLYTHPVNDQRQQRGLLPVNSFWVSGCGAWGPAPIPAFPQGGKERCADAGLHPSAPPPKPQLRPLAKEPCADVGLAIDTSLRRAALADDAPAYQGAWSELDGGPLARMLEALDQGDPIQLTLCGERACITWSRAKPGAAALMRGWWRRLRGGIVAPTLELL